MCIAQHLPLVHPSSKWMLNAGAGVYELGLGEWRETAVDLFDSPLKDRRYAACASVEHLPFRDRTFGAIVCVGEVLGYCDPAKAILEFARVLVPSGILFCDFASSRSLRYWWKPVYGRAADIVTDQYNGTPERVWIYSPAYLQELLQFSGFAIRSRIAIHTWSALAMRLGLDKSAAVSFQQLLEWLPSPKIWGDLMTIVAVRGAS
jgi:SAM-dependent methyltransferase